MSKNTHCSATRLPFIMGKMGNSKRKCVVVLTGLGFAATLVISPLLSAAFAQTTPVANTYGTVPLPVPTTPINYVPPVVTNPCGSIAASTTTRGSVLSSVVGSAANIGAQIYNAKNAPSATNPALGRVNSDATISLDMNCGDENAGNTDTQSCDGLKGDTAIDAWLAKKVNANTAAMNTLACKVGQMNTMQNELSCFADLISNQQKEFQKFQDAVAPMLKDANASLQQQDQNIRDRTAQFTELQAHGTAMHELQKSLKEQLANSAATVAIARKSATLARQKQSQFAKARAQYEVGVAMKCFLDVPQPKYTCTSRDANTGKTVTQIVSPANYIACASVKASQYDSAGHALPNSAGANKTGSIVSSAISTIRNESNGLSTFPVDAFSDAALRGAATTPGFTTNPNMSDMATAQKYFAAQMAQLNSLRPLYTGMTVGGAANAALNDCKTKAHNQVVKEVGDTSGSSQISAASVSLKNWGDGLVQANQAELTKNFETYRSALVEVTGNSDAALNMPPCTSTSLDVQADCLQQSDTLMRSLLNGTPTSSSTHAVGSEALALTKGGAPITAFSRDFVAASDKGQTGAGKSGLSFRLNCVGVNACANEYDKAVAEISKQVGANGSGGTMKDARNAYVYSTNQQIRDKADAMAKVLRPQVDNLAAQGAKLEALMSKLHLADTDLNIDRSGDKVDDTAMNGDLMKSGDMNAYLSGKVSPIKDASGVKKARSDLLASAKEKSTKINDLIKANDAIGDAAAKCKADAATKAATLEDTKSDKAQERLDKLRESYISLCNGKSAALAESQLTSIFEALCAMGDKLPGSQTFCVKAGTIDKATSTGTGKDPQNASDTDCQELSENIKKDYANALSGREDGGVHGLKK